MPAVLFLQTICNVIRFWVLCRIRPLGPRPSDNMVINTSDGLMPDGTDAQTLRDLELNRERVRLHRARQFSFSVSPRPVFSSNDSYPISRSDDMRSRDRDRQRTLISNPLNLSLTRKDDVHFPYHALSSLSSQRLRSKRPAITWSTSWPVSMPLNSTGCV